MPNRVRSSQNFESRRPGFVVTDQAGNQHVQAFVDDGTVVSGGGGTVPSGGGTPDPHASTHENGGPDEISIAGLSGQAADPQIPLDHASTHLLGGGDDVNLLGLAGYPGGTSTFLRADGSFAAPPGGTPSAHATSHENGGTDEVLLDYTQINVPSRAIVCSSNSATYPTSAPASADPNQLSFRVDTLRFGVNCSNGNALYPADIQGTPVDIGYIIRARPFSTGSALIQLGGVGANEQAGFSFNQTTNGVEWRMSVIGNDGNAMRWTAITGFGSGTVHVAWFTHTNACFILSATRDEVTTGTRCFVIANGTAPTAVVANTIAMFSRDDTTAELCVMNEAAEITQLSGHMTLAAGKLIRLGGTSSSFPALKRSSAVLEVKLADDSAYAEFRAKKLLITDGTVLAKTEAALTNGASTTDVFSGAMLTLSGDDTAANYNNGGAGRTVPTDTSVYDQGGWISGSTFVVPSGVAFVDAFAHVRAQNLAASNDCALYLLKNGSALYNGVPVGFVGVTSGTAREVMFAGIGIPCAAGDVFTILMFVSADTSIDVIAARTSFSIRASGWATNGPASAVQPTKWIPLDDNGTTRHIPAW